MLVHQLFRLLIFLRVHQFLDLVVILMGFRIVVVVRTAGPEGGLVQRNALVLNPSEHIAAHVAVADQQAVQPDVAGGMVVPQHHFPTGFGLGLGAGNECGKEQADQEQNFFHEVIGYVLYKDKLFLEIPIFDVSLCYQNDIILNT